MTEITMEEFCRAIKTTPECWVFVKMKEPNFWKETDTEGNTVYNFDNGIDLVREFKDMPLYKEIWMRSRDRHAKNFSVLWGTWTDYD